jgi:hypothetical protein
MRKLFITITLPLLVTCKNSVDKKPASITKSKKDTIYIHDTTFLNNVNNGEWQIGFGLTHDPQKDSIWNKPVSFYLNDEQCNSLTFDFYYGYSRPSDNGATAELLKLACTDNTKLRPFYRWCLDKTISVSDGALSELVGVPARKYAEKFPDEFFEYLDTEKDKTKYGLWTEAIQYSGFFDYPEFNDMNKQINEHYNRMSKNLKDISEKNLKRVLKFAKDCQAL